MTDDKDAENPGEVIEDMMIDPRTRGYIWVSLGPNLDGVTLSGSDEIYETSVILAASVLRELITYVDRDAEGYLKDVIRNTKEMELGTPEEYEERHD